MLKISRQPSPSVVFVMGIVFVVCCCLISAFLSSRAVIFNADTTSNIFLFQLPLHSRDILLADYHTSILKAPLLMVEGALPKSLLTFTLFNALVVIASILLWSYTMARAFDRRLFMPLAILLSLITLGALRFAIEISFVTIRNIEYPLWLFLVIQYFTIANNTLENIGQVRRRAIVYTLLSALLIINDQFFILLLTIPIVLSILSPPPAAFISAGKRKLLILTTLLLAPIALAKATVILFKALGIYVYSGPSLHPVLYDFFSIPKSFMQSLYDLMQFFNADIFSRSLSPRNITYYLGATLFIICTTVFLRYWKQGGLKKPDQTLALTIHNLWFSILITFLIYVCTYGLDRQTRYLTLIVFALPTLTIIQTKDILLPLFSKNIYWLWLALTIVAMLLVRGTLSNYRALDFFRYYPQRQSIDKTIDVLNRAHVDTVVAADQYSMALKFWTNGRLNTLPVYQCDQPLPYLVRRSWYNVHPGKFALIQDTEPDGTTGCATNQAIFAAYGKPLAVYHTPSLEGAMLDVYVFNGTSLPDLHSKVATD